MPRTWLSLFSTQLSDPDMRDFMSSIEQSVDDWTKEILWLVVLDVVTYLKSYTSKRNPPRYRRKWTLGPNLERVKVTKKNVSSISPDRPAHPGGWSDVEGDLRDNYYGRVEPAEGGGHRGVIGNRSGHAAYVEAKDGYFVITGLFDKNGPVFKALVKYMRLYAPGVKVVNNGVGVETNDKGTGIIDSVTARAL